MATQFVPGESLMTENAPKIDTALEKAFHQWLDLCPVHFQKQFMLDSHSDDDYIIAFFLRSQRSKNHD